MTIPRVRLYDIDTGAYDVSSDGNSVGIYGAAYFAGAALDPVSFRLILTRADNENPEGAAMIAFDAAELAAAGFGLASEAAEAALLGALRTPGYQTAGAHWLLLPCSFATMSEALLAAYKARQRFHLLQFSVVAQ